MGFQGLASCGPGCGCVCRVVLWGHTCPFTSPGRNTQKPPCLEGQKGEQDVVGGMKRGSRRLAALAGAALAFALLCSLWAGVASAARGAGTAPGTLEICKAPDNGANGQSFSFTA